MTKRFENKVALITGATSGIGRESALAFARHGARVVLASQSDDEGQRLVEQIRNSGEDALFIHTDVSIAQDVERMVDRTLAAYGRLDFAFNNAGIGGDVLTPLAEHTEDNWDRVIGVNLKGVWLCMKYQIPPMVRQGGGSIVNNSSIYGLRGGDMGHAPYDASKHGVIGLTRTAAHEYAEAGIRVNALCPGYTRTELVDRALEANPGLYEKLMADVPMGRLADTPEIVNAALWLCSDDSSFVTGQALAPDGGRLAT